MKPRSQGLFPTRGKPGKSRPLERGWQTVLTFFLSIVISERIFQVKNEKKKDGKQLSFEFKKPPQVCASWKV